MPRILWNGEWPREPADSLALHPVIRGLCMHGNEKATFENRISMRMSKRSNEVPREAEGDAAHSAGSYE